jgi:hypothetical protein
MTFPLVIRAEQPSVNNPETTFIDRFGRLLAVIIPGARDERKLSQSEANPNSGENHESTIWSHVHDGRSA